MFLSVFDDKGNFSLITTDIETPCYYLKKADENELSQFLVP